MENKIILYAPEIPQNTGAIARTCAATGVSLHLIKPLGFDISDSAVKRAGLDYWKLVDVHVYDSLDDYFCVNGDDDIWLLSTKSAHCYDEADFSEGASLMFGRETSGLPEELLQKYYPRTVRIPMKPQARSLNLAASAAIVLYEALRQQSFRGLMKKGILSVQEDFD